MKNLLTILTIAIIATSCGKQVVNQPAKLTKADLVRQCIQKQVESIKTVNPDAQLASLETMTDFCQLTYSMLDDNGVYSVADIKE
jgi:hypothetical protein